MLVWTCDDGIGGISLLSGGPTALSTEHYKVSTREKTGVQNTRDQHDHSTRSHHRPENRARHSQTKEDRTESGLTLHKKTRAKRHDTNSGVHQKDTRTREGDQSTQGNNSILLPPTDKTQAHSHQRRHCEERDHRPANGCGSTGSRRTGTTRTK